MLLGIEQKLIIPPAIGAVDAATLANDQANRLPASLEEAILAFATDRNARAALGEAFSEYFLGTRQWELQAWQRSVSNWERDRYRQIT